MAACFCDHPLDQHLVGPGGYCKGTVDDGVIRYSCHCREYIENALCVCGHYRANHFDREADEPARCHTCFSCIAFRTKEMASKPAVTASIPKAPKEIEDDPLMKSIAKRFSLIELD